MSPHKLHDLMSIAFELEGAPRIRGETREHLIQIKAELIVDVWDRELQFLFKKGIYPDMDDILDLMHSAIDRILGRDK